jgi:hypothetical protein
MFQRRGTTAQWAAADPILAAGEIGLDLDLMRIKMGDGIASWSELEFYAPPGHAEDADPHPQYTTASELASAVSAAIAAVVGAAPATLDTLDELAAALADDANFSATIVAALAGKQQAIQFKDDGTDRGALGAVSTVDFTGAGVTASLVGGVLTVNIAAGGGGTPGVSNGALIANFDNGSAALAVGMFCDCFIPYAVTINDVTMLADTSGSVVVGVYCDTYGNFPPSSLDNIAGSLPPTISGATKSYNATLTGWTPAIPAGRTVRFEILSCSGIKKLHLSLGVTK